MANFVKDNKNVHGLVLQASAKAVYELGLWGPVDTRTGKELVVSLSPPDASVWVLPGGMVPGKEPIRNWTFIDLKVGRTLVVAKDSGGAIWTSVTLDVFESGGKKYTKNPHEVATRHTNPPVADIVGVARRIWPGLTENGGRTLAAQSMHETGKGEHCYNFNLGNIKCYEPSKPHMYLNPVWECVAPANVEKVLTSPLASTATPDQEKKWPCPGQTTIVFKPPHAECRFRAYSSLHDGAQDWLAKHKKVADHSPGYLASVNAGDTDAVASAMKRQHYYTGNEGLYKQRMKEAKLEIDRTLGATDSLLGF